MQICIANFTPMSDSMELLFSVLILLPCNCIASVLGELDIKPLWNQTSTDCFVEFHGNHGNQTNLITYHGGSQETCSLQVTTSPSVAVQMQLSDQREDQDYFLYVERLGELSSQCPNKYIAIKSQSKPCHVILRHPNLQLNLQGNTSVTLTKQPFTESGFFCPELNPKISSEVNQTTGCSRVEGYNQTITCKFSSVLQFDNIFKNDPSLWQFVTSCNIKLSTNCTNSLGHYEVHQTCTDGSDEVDLILYPLNMKYLNLKLNKMTIRSEAFKDFNELVRLDLSRNDLTSLSRTTFQNMTSLSYLDLSFNNFMSFEAGVFDHLKSLRWLDLNFNKLKTFSHRLIANLLSLQGLFLERNDLAVLESGTFGRLNLTHLDLSTNNLSFITPGLFDGLQSLQYIYLQFNPLVTLGKSFAFTNLNLQYINLGFCSLNLLSDNVFQRLKQLELLILQNNEFKTLGATLFHGLSYLTMITVSHNRLMTLDAQIFSGLYLLEDLFLDWNKLEALSTGLFQDLGSLTLLDLSNNKLQEIPNLVKLTKLNEVYIEGNTLIAVFPSTFSNLQEGAKMMASQHEICQCYVPEGVDCGATLPRSPYLTCDRLMSDKVLNVMMWIFAVNALAGNLFVLVWRKTTKHKENKVQTILLSNLAMSDLLMGVYMLIIASADIYFGDEFPLQAEAWRSGITCRIAGAISIISSEASVFFVMLISIDRYINCKDPFTSTKLHGTSSMIWALLIWIICLALGIAPSVLAGVEYEFYDNSHVCIGLPLAKWEMYSQTTDHDFYRFLLNCELYLICKPTFTWQSEGYKSGHYFASAMFLGLNFLCYLIILICYIGIIQAVSKSNQESGGVSQEMKKQIKFTVKVSAIVATDFACWFPIICLGILVQSNVLILPASVFAWCVTFVLPINSAINPYLYTIADIISRYKKKKLKK